MSNAIEFISCYNVIDARLRALYRGKGNLQFTDLVRRCAEQDKTVRKYEEELMSFARLRNAIVHNSTRERIIAEPCDDVTALIRRIAELLSAPPQLKLLREKGATGISADATVRDAVIKAAKTGYSNLPVYSGERTVGILNNRRLVRAMGEALQRGESVEEVLSLPCRSILREEDLLRYYKILGRENTVQEAIDAFEENRKLLAVVVTERGRISDKIVNIITPSDLPSLLKLLEE